MGLVKRTYTDNVTVITADNLNDIQDAVIELEGDMPDPSSANPQMDGTASAGVSGDYSRTDHVHPSDTSRADATEFGYVYTDFDFEVGTNLIDVSKLVMGYELKDTLGAVRANDTWYVTDWIEVEPSTTYTISGTSSKYRAEVNATKDTATISGSNSVSTFTTGSSTKYVRFNSRISGYSTPQLQKGSTATPYESYKKISAWKSDLEIKLFADGRNTFNPSEAIDNKVINTSGAETSNASYWSTGYVDIGGMSAIVLPVQRKLRYAFYNSSKTFISYGTDNNPVSVPNNAKYIRISYSKDYVPFANRYNMAVFEYGANASFEHETILNPTDMSVRDEQYFNIKAGDYTESFSVSVKRGNNGVKNSVVSFCGYYTGDTAPTIKFEMPYSYDKNFYTSQEYTLGNDLFNSEKQWRIPAFPANATDLIVRITIPTGTTLHLKYLYNAFDNSINRTVDNYRLNAHLGTPCIYPYNTLISFESAAKLGYPCCVTVPKRTSDGVWVCFHDDSNVGNTLRMPNGSNLPSADASKSISDFTYEELLAYDAGIKTNKMYGGEKVPTLEMFFSLCQKTGMHPMLSVHPYPNASEWAEIKALAKKYNVLKCLNLKFATQSAMYDAYEVLGDDVESYAQDISYSGYDPVADILALGMDLEHAKLGIEYYDDVITETLINNALSNGLFVACFIQFGTASEYETLLNMGVTEITDDNNCSFGLNW